MYRLTEEVLGKERYVRHALKGRVHKTCVAKVTKTTETRLDFWATRVVVVVVGRARSSSSCIGRTITIAVQE